MSMGSRKKTHGMRLISAFLSFTLLLGMAPITMAAGPRDMSYNFLRIIEYYTPNHQWSEFKQTGYPMEQITSLDMMTKGNASEKYPDSSIATDPWCYVASNPQKAESLHYEWGTMFDFSAGAGCFAQFKVRLDTAGEYEIITQHTKNYYSPVVDVYLAPVDAADATAAEYKRGQIDPSVSWSECPTNKSGVNAGTWTASAFSLGNHQLNAGEYLLTYKFAKPGRNNFSTKFTLAGLNLRSTYVDPGQLTLSASQLDPIIVGNTAQMTLGLFNQAGQAVEFTADQLSISARDSKIVDISVDAQNTKNIKISGISRGETTIDATITMGDRQAKAEIPVSVIGDANQRVLTAGALRDVEIGKSRTTAINLANGNGDNIPFEAQNVTLAIKDENIASAKMDANGGKNIIVTGRAQGETTLTASVTLDGKIVGSVEIAIKVLSEPVSETPRKLSYNYRKLAGYFAEDTNAAKVVQDVIHLSQTTKGSSNEIYPASSQESDPWCYVDASVDQTKLQFDPQNSYIYGTILNCSEEKGGWARFKVDVPADGLYQAFSLNSFWYMMGITELFLAPVDAPDPMAAKYSLGTLDAYRKYDKGADAENWIKEFPLNACMLSRGEYYLTYKIIGTNSPYAAYQLFFSQFDLRPMADGGALQFTMQDNVALKAGTEREVPMSLNLANGVSMNMAAAEIIITDKNPEIATAKLVTDPTTKQNALLVTGKAQGTSSINVLIKMNGAKIAEKSLAVTIDAPGILSRATLEFEGYNSNRISILMHPRLIVKLYDQDNELIPFSKDIQIVYKSDDAAACEVSPTGEVTPKAFGKTGLRASVTLRGVTLEVPYMIEITDGKVASTYYTPERVEAARENAEKYSWARVARDAAVKNAEKYLNQEEFLWNAVTTQELPRGITVGYRHDPNAFTCRYCGEDLRAQYGEFSWIIKPFEDPYKIQCPACRRKFPSNNFEAFYKTGIDEHGNWSYEKAKQDGAEFLKNELYPEKPAGWGVDDGYGYKTGNKVANVEEVHTYIAYYNHWGLWHSNGILQDALSNLQNAYIYTGDIRYGRVGAILIDRMADVYPDMNLEPYFPRFFNSDSTQPSGKAIGSIWECSPTKSMARAYDAFYPIMDDPAVLNFLSSKAKQYQIGNSKQTGALIRQNCEDGILREIYKAAKRADIHGNFGMHQSSVATAAVILDTMPETKEMIDWTLRSGGRSSTHEVTGGNVLEQMLATIDRDGMGNESSPQYNYLWLGNLGIFADTLAGYSGYASADLYNNPKFIKMFSAAFPLTLARSGTAQIGDSGRVASRTFTMNIPMLLKAFEHTGDPKLAQMVYHLNGGKADGLHTDIFTKNPESIGAKILEVIRQHGEYDFDRSEQMSAYGFSILRDGSYYPSQLNTGEINTQRDFWMYYGGGTGHKHPDGLNLGLEAYGVNMAPDLGYPVACDGSDNYKFWSRATLNHNTVMVNRENQINNLAKNGNPLHFDDAGRVKIMDVSMPQVYAATDIYRRTVVMVKASDEVSYGIDFFRVQGGNDHVYSFHSQSDEISEISGVTLQKQADASGKFIGSYAGTDVPYGTANSYNGYSWFKNVEKAENPQTGSFAVDFNVKDFRETGKNNIDLHLRMTMLNDFNLDEVSITEGEPAQVDDNPEMLKFVFARRTGKNLDSLFTTAFEPYRGERYIQSIEPAAIQHADGSALASGEVARAVKVTLKNGRVDYVVYATDNTVDYLIDGLFAFTGFVGVLTVNDGHQSYAYVNDGTKIGSLAATAAYTGTVLDYTKELSSKNTITVSFDQAIDPENLIGRQINIANDGTQNAVYKILGAADKGGNTYVLDIGDITLVRGSKNATDISEGFVYNIAPAQRARVALSAVDDVSPIFKEVSPQRADAGHEWKLRVSAESPVGKPLHYSANTLPRGAQFDPKTQTISWSPDRGQLGKNQIAIDVTDGVFTVTQHITIEVYSQTDGSSPVQNPGGEVPKEEPKNETVTIKPTISQNQQDVTVKTVANASGYNVILPGKVLEKDFTVHTPFGSVTLPGGKAIQEELQLRVLSGGAGKVKIGISPNTAVKGNAKIEIPYTQKENEKRNECIVAACDGKNIVTGRFENGKMIIIDQAPFGTYEISYQEKKFNDLNTHKWAEDAIYALSARGVIRGVAANQYAPGRNITRADFVLLLVRALELTSETKDGFSDVKPTDYFAKEVSVAKELGIIKGQGNNQFNPRASITREDMMTILARALKLENASEDVLNEFADKDLVSPYAVSSAANLVKSGFIAGANGKILPKGLATRAEIAVILYRMLNNAY